MRRGLPDSPNQPEIKINERLLLRLLKNPKEKEGPLDEVVCYDEYGNCEFHLEKMDDMQWWMRFYSTKGRQIPREVVVRIGPSGAYLEFEEPYTHQDDGLDPTPPEEITKEVGFFLRYYGMKMLLKEMISFTEKSEGEERLNWPDREVTYLQILREDLTLALQNYEGRYNDDHGPGVGDDDA